jgi:hypothetical protein
MTAGPEVDDDHETFMCYRHPSRETALRCLECDRPICVDCANHGPVGIKCPECARTSRAARGVVPTTRLVRGLVAGTVVAIVLGTILYVAPTSFFGIILAYLAGMATGEVTRRASGGYRDPVLARGATIAAAVGVLTLPVLDSLAAGAVHPSFVWTLLAGVAAAFGAHSRAA